MFDKEKVCKCFSEYKPFLKEEEYLEAKKNFERILEKEEVAEENIRHCYGRIFPMIAIYMTLKERYCDALARVEEVFNKKEVYPGIKKMQKFMKIPFIYKFMLPLAKKFVRKSYKECEDGFQMEILESDKNTFRFKIHQCTYYNYCKNYNVAELCDIFCKSDDISGNAMKPHILFKRENTLARGGKYCDFYYKLK